MEKAAVRFLAPLLLIAALMLTGCPGAHPPELEPLAWGMDMERATAVLKRAGLSPRRDENRMYIANPVGPVVHASEPVLLYVPGSGWTGQARFDEQRGLLREVSLRAERSTSELHAEVAALEQRFGPPSERRGENRTWERSGIRIMLSASEDLRTRRWSLLVSFLRDERPGGPASQRAVR